MKLPVLRLADCEIKTLSKVAQAKRAAARPSHLRRRRAEKSLKVSSARARPASGPD